MRTFINTVFSKLNTVVYYTWPEAFLGDYYKYPTVLSSELWKWKASKLLYRVTDNNLTDVDLAEYGIKFDLPKNKINNSLVSQLFDDDTKELFGIDYSELQKLENFVVPSCIESNDDSKIDYEFFGNSTSNSDGTKLYLLDVPKNCSRIELYTNSIDSNVEFSDGTKDFYRYDYITLSGDSALFWDNGKTVVNSIKPDMVINLGPDTYEYYNKSSYYHPNATYMNYTGIGSGFFNSGTVRRSLELSISSYELDSPDEYFSFYRRLEDEIFSSKLIWFVIHKNQPTQIEVNLAKRSFHNSKNPLRKRNEYCLRNDDLYKLQNSFDLIYKKDENVSLYYEKSTDSIIGSTVINKTPILSKKLEILDKKLETHDYEIYSKFVTYELGDVVKYNGNYYESISNNNTDEPLFSSSWILKENFDGYFTKCIHFISDPPGAITFIPRYATVPNNECGTLKLIAIENHGYTIDEYTEVAAVGNLESKTLNLPEDFTYLNAKTETDDDFKKTFTIIDWKKINSITDCNKVVFEAKQALINVSTKIRLNGEDITLLNKKSIDRVFRSRNITSETFCYVNDSSKSTIGSSSSIIGGLSLDDKISIELSWLREESRNFEISRIYSLHHSTSGDYTKELELDEDFSFSDTVDSTEIEIYIDLKSKKKNIKLIYNCTDFEVNYPFVDVRYGESISLQFYTIFNPETEKTPEFKNAVVSNLFPVIVKRIENGVSTYSDDEVFTDICELDMNNSIFLTPSDKLLDLIDATYPSETVYYEDSKRTVVNLFSTNVSGTTIFTLNIDHLYNDLEIHLTVE